MTPPSSEDSQLSDLAGSAQSQQLHRRLRTRIMFGLLCTNLLIGTLLTSLLYNTQVEQLEDKLHYESSLEVSALASELLRFKNISNQITSRRHIRQELGRFTQGEVDKASVIAITRPTLEDAIRQSVEITGINRLDSQGNSLVSVGSVIPDGLWPQNYNTDSIQIGNSGLSVGRHVIVLSAPILDPQGNRIGTDIIAFDTQQIRSTLDDFLQRRDSQGMAFIVDANNQPLNQLSSSAQNATPLDDITLTSTLKLLPGLASTQIHDIEISGVERILFYESIAGTDWAFVFVDNSDVFYSSARANATYIIASIILLSLIGILLTLLLIRPLSGRISIEIDTLQQLARRLDDSLKTAKDNAQKLQSILDNTPTIIFMKDKSGRYLLVNKAFEQANQIHAAEILGKTDPQIHDTPIADKFLAEDQTVMDQGQPIHLEETIHQPDGPHIYSTVKFPMYDSNGEIYALCGVSIDISERKLAEVALTQSEARYRNLVESTHDWIWEVDKEGFFTYVSPRITHQLGYQPTEVIGRSPFEFMPTDCAQRVEKTFRSIVEQRKPFDSLESIHLHKNGSQVVVETNGEPIFNAAGEFGGYRGSNRDITDRKKLEGRERVRLMVLEKMAQGETMASIINTLVTQGEIEMPGILCSVLMLDETGTHLRTIASPSLDEAYNTAIDGVELGPQAGPLAAAIEQDQQILVEKLEQYPYWETYTHLAHRAGLIACCAQPVHDSHGQVLGVLGLFFREPRLPTPIELKLTLQMAQLAGLAIEQHLNESALRSSEERFDLAMRASNDGLWDWDLRTDFVYYSPRWKSMLGYATDELDNHISSWERLIDPDDLIRAKSTVIDCFRAAEKNFSLEFRMRHKYGHWVYILSRALILYDDDKQAIRIVGTHVDVSEQKQLEQRLRDSENNLLQERDFINAMIESAPSIIIVLDRNGRIIRFNEAAEQLTGFSFAELQHQPVWEHLIPLDVRDRVQQVFENLKAGDIQARYQNQWLTKDGSQRMLDWHNSIIKDDDGLVTHIIAQGYEITEAPAIAK